MVDSNELFVAGVVSRGEEVDAVREGWVSRG
jgi:hypothetical protein